MQKKATIQIYQNRQCVIQSAITRYYYETSFSVRAIRTFKPNYNRFSIKQFFM